MIHFDRDDDNNKPTTPEECLALQIIKLEERIRKIEDKLNLNL